jgi:putative acetyltransferase
MPDVIIEQIDPGSASARALIAASDAFYDGLYPAESNHLEATSDLKKEHVIFMGCRIGDELVASGGAKLMQDDGDYAEIKRVFVLENFRGRGLSRQINRDQAARGAWPVPQARLPRTRSLWRLSR